MSSRDSANVIKPSPSTPADQYRRSSLFSILSFNNNNTTNAPPPPQNLIKKRSSVRSFSIRRSMSNLSLSSTASPRHPHPPPPQQQQSSSSNSRRLSQSIDTTTSSKLPDPPTRHHQHHTNNNNRQQRLSIISNIDNNPTPSTSRPGRPTVSSPVLVVSHLGIDNNHHSNASSMSVYSMASSSKDTTTNTTTASQPPPPPHPIIQRPKPMTNLDRLKRALGLRSSSKRYNVFGRSLRDGAVITRSPANMDVNSKEYWVSAVAYKCIEYLDTYGLQEEGLYRISGSAAGIEDLRQEFIQFGPNVDLKPGKHDVHSVASLLKAYLREVPDPLIPVGPALFSLMTATGNTTSNFDILTTTTEEEGEESEENEDHPQHESTTTTTTTTKQQQQQDIPMDEIRSFISQLDPYNYFLLKHLCLHLNSVCEYSDKNFMTCSNLALILCPSLRCESKLFTWLVTRAPDCWQVECLGINDALSKERSLLSPSPPPVSPSPIARSISSFSLAV